MQKHAYLTKFQPLPISDDILVYFDDFITKLPCADNFPLLHYHSCYELGLCLKGEGVFLSQGRYATISAGDVVFIPPGNRHYSRSLHQNDPCLCRFWYLAEEMLSVTQLPPVLHPAEYPELVRLIADTPIQNGQAARFRLRAFLAEAAGLFPAAAAPVRPTASAAEQAAVFLSLHYAEHITAAELARRYHLSESQLRRQFNASYGMPPMAYRNLLRVRVAAELLSHTILSVGEIAERLGFSVPSELYLALKRFIVFPRRSIRSPKVYSFSRYNHVFCPFV